MGLNDFVRKKALYYKRKFDTSDPFKLAESSRYRSYDLRYRLQTWVLYVFETI